MCNRLWVAPPDAISDALTFAQDGPDRIALCLFPAPTPEDVNELAAAWELHPLLVEDLQHAGQWPKLERYGIPEPLQTTPRL